MEIAISFLGRPPPAQHPGEQGSIKHPTVRAERGGQLDPQSLAAQSVGVLIGSPSFIAGSYLGHRLRFVIRLPPNPAWYSDDVICLHRNYDSQLSDRLA